PLNPDVSFIHAPTVAGRFQSRAQTSFQFRAVTLDPSPHRDVIGVQAPLGQQLLHITIGKREAQIPTDSQENHLRFKLAPLEQTRNRTREQEHRTNLSDHSCKVATLPVGMGTELVSDDRHRGTHYKYNDEYYLLKHISHFVKPGARRLD